MDKLKIGSPLFILRERCSKDLFGVIDKIAEAGFDGIEFLGFFGRSPEEIKQKLNSVGLEAVGNHVPYNDFVNEPEKVLRDHITLGCEYITIAPPGPSGMPGGADYKKTIENIDKIGAMMKDKGMKLLFHNHGDEMKILRGRDSVLENILDDSGADLLYLEPDLGWMRIGGGDPIYYLEKYKERCPVIHFKDYYAKDLNKAVKAKKFDGPKGSEEFGRFEFRPVGYGMMNWSALYAYVAKCNPKWYVMDHDCSYERDEIDDLKISLEYFKKLTFIAGG